MDISAFRRKVLIGALRATVNMHVAAGTVEPDEALGALMYVVAHFIGKVKDPEARRAHLQTVLDTLPAAVDFEAGNQHALALCETEGTRQ